MTSDIIAKYNLQVDDQSELSSTEELDLAQDVYEEVCNDRDWEWLKATATGTTSTTVAYIALPSDFKKMSMNKDNISVVFVGSDFQEYIVIPFSSRRDHRDQDGFCYLDMVNNRLYFTLQPTSAKAVEYDYIKVPTALTLSTSPVFRSGYHNVIAFGMAARFNNIEQTDKSISYQRENQALYRSMISDMAVEDANIKLAL